MGRARGARLSLSFFLVIVVCLAALSSMSGCRRRGASSRPVGPPAPPDLALVYSAGVRGALAPPAVGPGGLARRATLVDRARLAARAVVQVDAGDLIGGADDEAALADTAEKEKRARLAFGCYRRMGVDAVTVGESELALGAEKLRAFAGAEKVALVASNLVDAAGRPLFDTERVVKTEAMTVGIFGVLDMEGTTWSPPPGVVVTDPALAARAAVASLKAKGARLVVGLFHVAGGLTRARVIATAAAGVDVVVLGHAGPSAPPTFVATAARGVNVGRLDVRLSKTGDLAFEDHLLMASAEVAAQYGVWLVLRAAEPIAATFDESIAMLTKVKGFRPYGEDWTYGTTGLCKSCHGPQWQQWQATDHAHAFATLDEGHEHDPRCMGCHMTGFLVPGGVQNYESALQFGDVGCESCHGPSVAHVTSGDKHTGTSRSVDPIVCLGCHTPDQNRGPFVLADAMKEIVGPGHGQPAKPPAP